MSRDEDKEAGGVGCGSILAWGLATEVAWWIVIGLVGWNGSVSVLVGTLLIAVVFFMIYGTIRVLRGHDL